MSTTGYRLNTFFAFSYELPATSYQLSANLPLAAENRLFLPLLPY
jgi:hypothetical protein